MKNYILMATATLVMTTACQQGETAEQIRQREMKDSLIAVISDRERSVNDFITAFNEVEHNLDSVSLRQHVILLSSNNGDSKLNQKVRINHEIEAINDLMDQNRKRLAELSSNLKKSKNKNIQLEETIATLTNQITQKDVELAELNRKLIALDSQIAELRTSLDTLSLQNLAKSESINDKTIALHTAYFKVASTKDLKKANLIERKGGVLGIGRTSQLNQNLDKTQFTQIDYTETTSIPINSKDFKMITPHPTDSYTLDKKDKMVVCILINNPEKFWSESKYLVVCN